ncbi:MAG TPA: acyl-CoA dehydrogenase family protein [Oligoflexia bacterium]|nr:acyl-CoA dehydrogenase family protein [Oligoflexia bacterium]HMP27057.1 acyl-CoA dehydrogenase family protein [Oligoflexia bacterium]
MNSIQGNIFNFTQEQLELREQARRFSQSEILPKAAYYDETSEFPEEIIRKAWELGFCNIVQDSSLGGSGLSTLEACLVLEEIAAACSGFATSIFGNDLGLTPINLFGTAEQKERLIGGLIKRKGFTSFCLSEPGAGSDAAGLTSALTKTDKGYLLNGVKQWITNGGVADQYTVFATLDKSLRHKGICCVVVSAKAPGVSCGPHEKKLGQRASNTVQITFNNVEVPKENLIGGEGEGFKIAMRALDCSRPLTAIFSVGIARAAYEYALAYSKERKQFGQPISQFQAIQFMLADMITNIEAARLLTWQSAKMLDAGLKSTLASSMAKRFAADMAMQVALDAVQIYGGYGYTKDYPVEKLMRDAKLIQIYEGTSQIQRVVIAKEILKDS